MAESPFNNSPFDSSDRTAGQDEKTPPADYAPSWAQPGTARPAAKNSQSPQMQPPWSNPATPPDQSYAPPPPQSGFGSSNISDSFGASQQNEPVQYDFAGNPLPQSSASPPADSFGGAWPPPPSAYGQPMYPGREPLNANNSGTHTGSPPEIMQFKWNWGTWFFSWIWCFANGLSAWGAGILALSLLSIVPMVGAVFSLAVFGIHIYLSINGHHLSWENRRYNGGFPQFLEVQKAWTKWAIGYFVVSLLLVPILAAILFPVFVKAREEARIRSGYYASHPYVVPTIPNHK